MKNLFIAASFLLGFGFASAQALAAVDPMADRDLMTWYHKDFSATNVYGINTQNAYKYLESKGLKPTAVVVGVLDGGVEVDHPGLIRNMWKNPNEVPNNGKDDDGNGYVDDIHGWNFIGGKNGDIEADNMEVTRMVKKYQSIFEGPNSVINKTNQAKMREEFDLYMKSREIYNKKGIEAKQSYRTYTLIDSLIPTMVSMLNGKNLTAETLATVRPATPEQAMSLQTLSSLAMDPAFAGKTPEQFQIQLKEQMKQAIADFETQATKHYNLDFDPRAAVVGDNYEDYNDRYYGNNNYEGPDAGHGTHVAGIIAGLPQGDEVQYGVASKVARIMAIRTVPNGDERDKDVANSIRYAVDNGAKILNMSFGKPVSPGKEEVWDAFKYAEDKGVLLVKAAGNDNEDLSGQTYFPTNFKSTADEKPFITNMIVVGASTKDAEFLRASFSNFNGKMVDVFAPGQEIYAPVPDAKYKYEQGTSMASPVVAGAAAVLLAYMPNLTPEQIIESFVMTANKSTVNAMLPTNTNNRFDMISRSGGVIDLRKAAEFAFVNYYRSSSANAPVKRPVLKKSSK